MLKNSWISENFDCSENFKAFYEVQTASRLKGITQLHPTSYQQIKASYTSGTNISLQIFTRIYNCFENPVLGCIEMVSANVFPDINQKHVYWKICKVSEVFCCFWGVYIFYNSEWVKVQKMSKVFLVKLYCKMNVLFRYFLLTLRISIFKTKK